MKLTNSDIDVAFAEITIEQTKQVLVAGLCKGT